MLRRSLYNVISVLSNQKFCSLGSLNDLLRVNFHSAESLNSFPLVSNLGCSMTLYQLVHLSGIYIQPPHSLDMNINVVSSAM